MDFKKKFSEYSNTELLKIIDNPDDYQTEAYEIAKTIFASRQLNVEEKELPKKNLHFCKSIKMLKTKRKKI